eukprot:CAMPEP_0182543444 /NCGR_PEP_ID=MMETSP1323-20130603/31666_1 /TAXON_ID=236787 /ORGANISM="Florenciella parvula, Strain RCC1693" /LENGTH=58 /DNA_ID=CAMNT_0024754381 /DNA_START=300 /DNA_END=473 /DNA_ORIENTATION=-
MKLNLSLGEERYRPRNWPVGPILLETEAVALSISYAKGIAVGMLTPSMELSSMVSMAM